MKCNIIAEIGWNHMGDISLAKEMVDAATTCGVDFVKFQTWSVSNLKSGEWDNDGRREIYEKAELSEEHHQELFEYCQKLGVTFLTSVFNHIDLSKVPSGCDYIKIPSSEMSNKLLLQHCRDRFLHILVSTGASTEQEILEISNYLNEGSFTLLHCVSSYPCNAEVANLLRIHSLRHFCPSVGYSDHTMGVSAPAYAMSHGCTYIEKHFTTDPLLSGRDNKFAATPDIMKQICSIRDDIACMIQDKGLEYQMCESDTRSYYRGRWG